MAATIKLSDEVIINERAKFEKWYGDLCQMAENERSIYFSAYEKDLNRADLIYYMNDFFNKIFISWLAGVQNDKF